MRQTARTDKKRLYRCAAVAVCALAAATAPGASAAVPASLHSPAACNERDAADGETATDVERPFVLCDDGVPSLSPLPGPGGIIPNLTGADAITVPAVYGGDGYTGLPPKHPSSTVLGADLQRNIAIDADLSLPSTPPPPGGYPLLVMMHGCCGGNKGSSEQPRLDRPDESWHYNNAWFASRGYAVLTYTARGFVDNLNRGSTGQTQLDSRRFEINDYQSLSCQVLATAAAERFDDVSGRPDTPGVADVAIDPSRVVVTGGSYGGGFTWLAITDPKWSCNAATGANGTEMSLAAAAPKYGWSDLAYTLVPTGHHSSLPGDLPSFDGCDTGPRTLTGAPCPGGGSPVGIAKMSIVAGLFASGNLVTGNHTTFPPSFFEGVACLESVSPPEANPLCAGTISTLLPEFLRDRSAYYQHDFFANIAADPSYRVAIFNAGALTDPLFPAYENRRMANRLLATVPGYPLAQHYGDYQHFVQNKTKGWADLCGADRHVCVQADYPGGPPSDLNADPPELVRTGITTRFNRFLDNYARPSGGYPPATPDFDVAAEIQACPQNAPDLGVADDEPGPRFSAASFEELAPNTLTVSMAGTQTTLSKAVDPHALAADPVVNEQVNGKRCPVHGDRAGIGVASYTSEPLPTPATMIGAGRLTIDLRATGLPQGFQLNARLYDVFPNGQAVMADRGHRRLTVAEIDAGRVSYELNGNAWRFEPGHRIRLEITQDDEPYLKATTLISSARLSGARLELPIREGGSSVGGTADPDPEPEPEPEPEPAPGPEPRRDQDSDSDCGNRIDGTNKRDRLRGTDAGDEINGRRGADRIKGRAGDDCLRGGGGADRLKGGKGADLLRSGRGWDRIGARDGERDRVRCGKGRDRATADRFDSVKGCELIKRRRR